MIREEAYVKQYKEQWELLEEYIRRIDIKGFSKLSAHELKSYLDLMKRVSHHLAYVRTHFPDSSLCKYLNQLSVRANNHLYVVKKTKMKHVFSYITTGFAEQIRQNKVYILTAFLIFMVGAILSFILVLVSSENATFFLPEQYIESGNTEMKDSGWEEDQFFFLSSYVMTNNIGVAVKSFVFSVTAGIMTVYVMFMNGALLGALSCLVMKGPSNMAYYWALILPHGIFELSAIFIAGGAGLRAGKALLLPGQYKRKDAFIREAKEAVMLMPGVVILLVLAGLIEGFFTPARIPALIKLAFAAGTGVIMALYIIRRGNYMKQ